MSSKQKNYTGADIDVLDGISHIRKRPTMYISSVDDSGIFYAFKEAFDNALDEYQNGHANKITVEIVTEGRKKKFLVRDNGRGIPVDTHKQTGESTLITVLSNLQAGGKFTKKNYNSSVGLNGVGIKATNATAEWFTATVWRDGKCYKAEFKRGRYDKNLGAQRVRERDGEQEHGTEISFWPDSQVFGDYKLDPKRLENHLSMVAYLCPGITISYKLDGEKKTFKCDKEDGLAQFIKDKVENSGDKPLSAPVAYTSKDGDIAVAFCWTDNLDDAENYYSWVNLSNTPEHGTHVTGATRAIGKALADCVPAKTSVTPAQLRNGLALAVSVKVAEPQFKGQTKNSLNNASEEKKVYEFLLPLVERYFAKEKKLTKEIIDRAVKMKNAQEQYKKLKKTVNGLTDKKGRAVLSDKLLVAPNCKPEERVLHIVEGNSAMGTAQNARDPYYQEVLALKGKIINAQRASVADVIGSVEVQSIISAIGIGIDTSGKKQHDFSKLRVGKIHIMTDADFC